MSKTSTTSPISPHLLIVDDMAVNRSLIMQIFKNNNYKITEAECGQQALDLVRTQRFDAMLLDIVMPDMDGIEVCKRIREHKDLQLLPIILITALDKPGDVVEGMDAGANDYVSKPFNPAVLRARVSAVLEQGRLTSRLDDAEAVLFSMARMVEARDGGTSRHCDRLAHMGVVFGKSLGLEHLQLEALRCGGVMHDIGKLGIPDRVLLKEGKLDAAEWEIMKQHTTIGAALCAPLRTMRATTAIVLSHHERMDGSGYPYGLKGSEIPLLARVFQLVDIYDALTSARPYKPAFSKEKTMAIMQEEADKGWWDPELMQHFSEIVRLDPKSLVLPDTVSKDADFDSNGLDILQQMYPEGVVSFYK